MFLSVSGRHVGAHPDWHQHGVSIESAINLGKQFIGMFRIRKITLTLNLGEGLTILTSLHLSDSGINQFIFIFDGVTVKTCN